MHLILCLPTPSHASEETNSISLCDDYPPRMPMWTLIISQLVLTKRSHASKNRKSIATSVDHAIRCQRGHKMYHHKCLTMPAKTQNVTQHVFTKSQRGKKVYLNKCWPNPSQTSDGISITCVERTPKMPGRTQYPSHQVLTKRLLCEPGQKIHLKIVVQKFPMPSMTHNVSLHVLTKPIPCQGGHKKHFNMCWPTHPTPASTQIAYQENLTHASEDIKCIN